MSTPLPSSVSMCMDQLFFAGQNIVCVVAQFAQTCADIEFIYFDRTESAADISKHTTSSVSDCFEDFTCFTRSSLATGVAQQ